MGEKVTIPAELQAKLAGANGGAIPLCDEDGKVLGYYLSADRMATLQTERRAMYDWANSLVTEEELDAAERAGGSHTMDEVFRLLEKK